MLEKDGRGESSGSSSSVGQLEDGEREEEEEEEDQEQRRPAEARKTLGKEAENKSQLEVVVERMERKLIELGVGEEEIRRILRDTSEPEGAASSFNPHRELSSHSFFFSDFSLTD